MNGLTVKELVRRARKARDRGNWTQAYEAYKTALDAANVPPGMKLDRADGDRGAFDPAEIAGELGLCELELRKYRDAAEHLTWSLERDWALPSQLQERFLTGQRKAAFYVVELVLSVDPPDAEILIDGQKIGRTARTYKLFLEPGRHMVRARAPGREDGFHAFNGEPGDKQEISMKLSGPAVSSAKDAPAAPKTASASPAVRPKEPGPWASWPGTLRIGGIGLTAATASLGAVFMVRASTADGDLDERNKKLDAAGVSRGVCREQPKPATCSELTRLRRDRDLFAGLGTAMVVTSGVVGAATVASFFTDFSFRRTEPTKARLTLIPTVAPAQVSLVAYGAW
ncbi:PEGA domain-containing protein [Sorangium cellulosum]|nr:PEGA domain-containing protein [Sorangium cellulosum]